MRQMQEAENMRTRKEIIESVVISDSPTQTILEVLLDIRDLLEQMKEPILPVVPLGGTTTTTPHMDSGKCLLHLPKMHSEVLK